MPLKKKRKTVKRKVVKRKVAKKRVAKRKVSKVIKKKPVKKAAIKKAAPKKSKEKIIGEVTHYFPQVRAAVIKLKVPLEIGDTVKIKGHTTDFKQKITSMQIDRVPIDKAKKGDEIGLLVDSRVRSNDSVYKV